MRQFQNYLHVYFTFCDFLHGVVLFYTKRSGTEVKESKIP